MRKRAWTALMIGLSGIFLVVALLGGDILVTAWHARWVAGRLLVSVKSLRPGVMSEAQAMAVLEPFEPYEVHYGDDSAGSRERERTRTFGVTNYPHWMDRASEFMPREMRLSILPYTQFSVEPGFTDGMLSAVYTKEAQENPDSIHPFATLVMDRAQRFDWPGWTGRREHFEGYRYESVGTSEIDPQGHVVREWPIVYQNVSMDERATPEERRRAYAFQLRCMTALLGCRSGSRISEPAADRNASSSSLSP